MADSNAVGMLVAGALSLGAEAAKTAAGEVVKDAYRALKTRLAVWATGDVTELEKTPTSSTRKAVIAEVVDALPMKDQEELRDLAQALTRKLKEEAAVIGLEVDEIDALQVKLGNISSTFGVSTRIRKARVGTFTTGDISSGPPPEKP